jgi:hypothetical protein
MLRSEFPDAGEQSPEALHDAYLAVLADTIETVGIDTITAETEVARETLTAISDGTDVEVSLTDAGSILGTDPDRPDGDAIVAEAQDILLLGMTTAVLDVEAVASGIDAQLEPKAIQQKIEGRQPMTLSEYAVLHSYIEGAKQ